MEPAGWLDKARLIGLQLYKLPINFLNRKTRAKEAEGELYRHQASWMTSNTVATFRRSYPPKYQSCQCLQAFVLFTDYYIHFERGSGLCLTSGRQGLFFPRYWVQADWNRQRQCEYEVQRVHNEHAIIQDTSTLSVQANITHHRGAAGSWSHRLHVKQAGEILMEHLRDATPDELQSRTVDAVLDMLKVFSSSRDDEVSIPVVVLHSVLHELRLPLKWSWIQKGCCESVEELKNWLESRLSANIQNSSDHASFSDAANNAKLQDLLGGFKHATAHRSVWLEHPQLTCMLSGKIRHRVAALSRASLEVLRLAHVLSSSALTALVEFRIHTPRRYENSFVVISVYHFAACQDAYERRGTGGASTVQLH